MVVELNANNYFNEVERFPGLVLVYAWATWCGPCKVMNQIVSDISDELADNLKVAKFDVDAVPYLASKFGIMGVPCFVLFESGKQVRSANGSMEKEALLDWILNEDAEEENDDEIQEDNEEFNTKICPNCGHENNESSKFCEACGAKLVADKKICPDCGEELKNSVKFCPNCGHNFIDEKISSSNNHNFENYESNMKICPNCGHENETDAVFCEICGGELSSDAESFQKKGTGKLVLPQGLFIGFWNVTEISFVYEIPKNYRENDENWKILKPKDYMQDDSVSQLSDPSLLSLYVNQYNGNPEDLHCYFYSPANMYAPEDSFRFFYSIFSDLNKTLKKINLENFDTKNVKIMTEMFYDLNSLTEIESMHFDTHNVTDMRGMFRGCNSIQRFSLKSFDTSKVTDMSDMFYECWELRRLDISNFNMKNVETTSMMFCDCKELTNLSLPNIDVENTYTASMFNYCPYEKKVSWYKG